MPCSQVAPEACLQADCRTFPLAGSLRGLGCTIHRAVVRTKRRSICKVATCPPTPPLPPSEIGSPSSPNEDLLWQHNSELARSLCPSLSSICNWLQEDDIRIIEVLPVSGGGFAELWRGSLENREVAIKSYRHYLTTDPSRISARFAREALVCSRLSHRHIVSFLGVYSSTRHLSSLVFHFAGHLDLKGYLKTHPTATRLDLLTGIARGLDHIHDHGIVHGRLETANVLVDLDGTARIAGLGSALILDHITPQSEMSFECLFRGSAPELMHPGEFGLTYPRNSKASDIYAFGVLAWEAFTGRAAFSGGLKVVAVQVARKGSRLPRPDHPEVTDRVWKMVERCLERNPSKRATIKQVVRILEAKHTGRLYGTF